MEEKPLPPVSSISSEDESNALDAADTNAPVSSYTLAPKTYPIETLEVRSEGETTTAKVVSSNVHATAFSRRRAMIISLTITMLVVVLTGIAVAFLVRSNTADDSRLERDIPTQGVNIAAPLPETEAIGLEAQEGSLLVNGDIVSSGAIRVTNDAFASVISTESLSDDQTFVLPNASGTICLDTNNCNYITEAEQTVLQAQIAQLGAQVGQITIPEIPEPFDGVTALNGQNGTLSIQGTANRVSIVTTNGVLRLTTPQDLAVISSPTFSNLLLTGGLTVNGSVTLPLNCTTFAAGGVLTTNAGGQVVCADDDDGGSGGVTTSGGTSGTIPLFTGAQTIGDSILTQSGTTVNVGGALTLSNALGLASGGTGLSATPTNGQLLIGNGTGYDLAALTQGSGITISNGSGSITITSTLGTDIATAEIVDNTILAVDLSSTNNPTVGQILTYDSSGGFTWQDAVDIVGNKVEAINALTGNISLQGTAGEIAVTDNGTDTLTLDLHTNVSLLGQSIGSGEIEADAVQLGAQTSGDYVANIGSLTGLSITGNTGEGSAPALAVLYGSTANTAVQGNASITCASGAGNLSGGGNSITLGTGGSCNDIAIVDNPTFGASVTTPLVQGNSALSIRSNSGGSYSQVNMGVDSIELNANSGTINLLSNTDVSGDLIVEGSVGIGSVTLNGGAALEVSKSFSVANDCISNICLGIANMVRVESTASTQALIGYYGSLNVETGQTLQQASSVFIADPQNSGVIDINAGIHIAEQTAGTVNYGLYIEGATDYSLYVQGGDAYFGDDLEVHGTASMSGAVINTLMVNDVVVVGTPSISGDLTISDGSSNYGNILTTSLTADRTYILPDADGTICLTSGNCIGGASGSAPANASYLMIAADPNLTSERSLTLGSNLTATDGGANSSYSINTVTNPTFTNVRTPIVSNTSSISIAATTSLVLTSSSSSSITLTSANQIVLNSSGTIELQDDTNITGSLAVDGNTLNVNATSNTVGIGVAAASQEILKLQSSSTKLEVYSAGDNDFELASDGAIFISVDNDNNDASDDASPAFNIVANGDYGNPILWVSQNGDIETTGSIFIEDFLTLGVSNVTVPDNGAGTPAAYALDPASSYVEITCNDADGCNVTMDETSAVEGDAVIIMNVSVNSVDLADSSGVHELDGNFSGGAMGCA